jgi:hypothetical protein
MKASLKLLGLMALLVALVFSACGKRKSTPLDNSPASVQLKHFIAEKKAQATAAADAEGLEMLPEFKKIFAAAEKGNWRTISNVVDDLRRISAQYPTKTATTAGDGSAISNALEDLHERISKFRGEEAKSERLHGTQWEDVKEVWGAFDCLASGETEDEHFVSLGQDIIQAVPAGSIYFGGTDPGRFVITALQKSHVNGDPFFTLTQNALADPGYLDYMRNMYGTKIYVPNNADVQQCFLGYLDEVQRRFEHDREFPKTSKQVNPGEVVSMESSGRIQVSAQAAVMTIPSLLAKVIFDHETNREFYLEESFPLDWMYPHLEPHGLILKLDREPLAELSDQMIHKDHEFWTGRVAPVIGDWLTYDTSVAELCAFARKVCINRDFSQFKGDRNFVGADWPKWMSKLRSSIGGVYCWRSGLSPTGGTVPPEYLAKTDAERQRMIREADFAFRQAFALCPESPEVVYRYVNFLVNHRRTTDGIAISEIALELHKDKPDADQFRYLLKNLKVIQAQEVQAQKSGALPTH